MVSRPQVLGDLGAGLACSPHRPRGPPAAGRPGLDSTEGGAVLPTAVPVYTIPESPYAYAAVNGQRVLIEPAARRIVYVF